MRHEGTYLSACLACFPLARYDMGAVDSGRGRDCLPRRPGAVVVGFAVGVQFALEGPGILGLARQNRKHETNLIHDNASS